MLGRHFIDRWRVSVTERPSRFTADLVFDVRAQLHRLTDRRLRLSREYEQRILDADAGPADMLSTSDLREAAADGPIVVINVSTLRCDAIIVQDSEPRAISLPELTYTDAASIANRYHESLLATQAASGTFFDALEAASDGGWEATQRFLDASAQLRNARVEEERMLIDTSNWLWHTVVQPVKVHLALPTTNGAPLPRLWWCPTGPLVGLPLHAAGTGPGPSAESVLDWVVSSYTPTITALLSARRSAARRPSTANPGTFLLLSLSTTPGEPPLPHVVAEAESILSRLPSDRVTVLNNEKATRQRVRHGFTAHRSVHLGCHAEQDLADPSNGALVLHDGRLTVLDLGRSRSDGDFAYLSACKTGTGGVALAEESVSMAAALHFAGFHRVIATLWSVQDAVAAQVADLVYGQMIDDGRFNPSSAALALHRALVHVRELNPELPSRWSPFVHLGI
ncbi:CHAT domain-containing protein [Streptomyces sp. NPDC127036]|uniref:CHAT domain-containing protein n=1 Tax=Streptomyces sp. NPDC127036 TaxID=3347112 RepID=UPI00365F7EAF